MSKGVGVGGREGGRGQEGMVALFEESGAVY